MDGVVCSIHALIACFNWSGLYLDAQIEYQDARYEERIETTIRETTTFGFGRPTLVDSETSVARSHKADNPYMRNAIGYQIQFKSVDVALELFHDSSMATNQDRGVNGIAIRARWFPFRH